MYPSALSLYNEAIYAIIPTLFTNFLAKIFLSLYPLRKTILSRACCSNITNETTNIVVIFRQDNIFVANVGDSTAVLGEHHYLALHWPCSLVVASCDHECSRMSALGSQIWEGTSIVRVHLDLGVHLVMVITLLKENCTCNIRVVYSALECVRVHLEHERYMRVSTVTDQSPSRVWL